MSRPVLELQRAALDRNLKPADLFRQALALSKKLGVGEVENWISCELNGYPEGTAIPGYREVHGYLRVRVPPDRQRHRQAETSEPGEFAGSQRLSQRAGELEDLTSRQAATHLCVPLPAFVVEVMSKTSPVPLEPVLYVPREQVAGVLDAARNNVLRWALDLEQNGVLGSDWTFSADEKAAASRATYQTIKNLGTAIELSPNRTSPDSGQFRSRSMDAHALQALMESIKSVAGSLSLTAAGFAELRADIETVECQARSPNPKKAIIREALGSLKAILDGCPGNGSAGNAAAKVDQFLKFIH